MGVETLGEDEFEAVGLRIDTSWYTNLGDALEGFTHDLYRIALHARRNGPVTSPDLTTEMPFCGCAGCVNRELVLFLMPMIVRAHSNGMVKEIT